LFKPFRTFHGILVCPKRVTSSPIAAYENTVEVQSVEQVRKMDLVATGLVKIFSQLFVFQLEEIISDPDEMRMQALLVRERILGPAHPDTSYYIR